MKPILFQEGKFIIRSFFVCYFYHFRMQQPTGQFVYVNGASALQQPIQQNGAPQQQHLVVLAPSQGQIMVCSFLISIYVYITGVKPGLSEGYDRIAGTHLDVQLFLAMGPWALCSCR